jgi:hypothetical protein
MQLTVEDKRAATELIALMKAVVDTVREMGPQGAPKSPIYLALQTKGVTMDFFNQLIEKLKDLGILRESGNVLYFVEVR